MSPEQIDRMAYSFAKPITQGYLSGSQAYAALAVATDGDATALEKAWAAVQSAVALYRDQQRIVAAEIRIALEPLIGNFKPPNVLLAEAHGVNGERGFWLTEKQVHDITVQEVEQSNRSQAPKRWRRARR